MTEGGDYKLSCCWLTSWQATEIIWILPFICTHLQTSFSWLVWKSVIVCRLSVQTIVLKHEEDVKHHREQTKAKLCGITKYQPPFIWRETHGRVRTIAFDTQSHGSEGRADTKDSLKVVHECEMNSWINELLSSISGVSLDQKCIWLDYVGLTWLCAVQRELREHFEFLFSSPMTLQTSFSTHPSVTHRRSLTNVCLITRIGVVLSFS